MFRRDFFAAIAAAGAALVSPASGRVLIRRNHLTKEQFRVAELLSQCRIISVVGRPTRDGRRNYLITYRHDPYGERRMIDRAYEHLGSTHAPLSIQVSADGRERICTVEWVE